MKEYQTILLAEDDPKDVELTLEALGELELLNQVVVVNDGAHALDYLRCEGQFTSRWPGNPIVILLDINMPRMDGLDLLRIIKNDPDLRTIPVVMLTTSQESSDLIASYELGVNSYVVKPVDFNKFVEVIKHLGIFWVLLNELPT